MSDEHRVTACTIVAGNYLPAARVLANSYLAHNPGHDFTIAVIDAAPDLDVQESGHRVVGATAFGISATDYRRMATAYSVTELATAVKPYLLRQLRAGADVVVYLDPDIEVFADLTEVATLAASHSVVLTPHFLRPLPRDGKEPGDAVIMGTGVFNLGFLAVGSGSEDFLDFWAERLRQDAIIAPEEQLFTDQRWVDQVPALFPHIVLRDPTVNVAYWNLHERSVEQTTDGQYQVDGAPLRFFHYSGYRPEKPWLLTYHCARKPRILLSDNSALLALCSGYGAALKAAGYGETLDSTPYGFARMADGTELTRGIRRLFRQGWIEAERDGAQPPPHAFGPDGGAALRDWLSAPADPAQAAAGVNRLELSIWNSRTDLQLAFPRPFGRDAHLFRTWCGRDGRMEGLLPDWAIAAEPAPLREPDPGFGVNVLGYLTATLGLGEMGRIIHQAIEAAGIDTVSVLEERAVSNRTDVEHDGVVGRPRYPVSVLAVNADQTGVVLENCPEIGHHRYLIGLWAWELEEFPDWQLDAFSIVDEVWTVSDFAARAISAKSSSTPVKTIPVPVRDPGDIQRRLRRSADPIQFLFAFDFNSVAERKNPWGLVNAFRLAFADRADARLVIKAINGELHPHVAERLRVLIGDDDQIELIERYLSHTELDALYQDSDCYVSLHRSEGFGLTVAEAMARAMPVIATDYSSTTEFLDTSTGWPVPYTMIKVGDGCFPYQADEKWADPDLAAAAAAMREVAADPAEAARRGQAARAHVLANRSMATTTEWVASQLQAAYRIWQQKPEQPRSAGVSAVLAPIRKAREALRWRADATAASRTPLAPALRRVVLRAIDHYDVHQRTVMSALTDGTEQAMNRLLDRVEDLEATITELREPGARDKVDVDAAHQHLTALGLRLDEVERTTRQVQDVGHQHLRARDLRLDEVERTTRQVQRDVSALHDAARLRHAPVPAGADVVLCDAGALLLPADQVMLPWLAHHRSWEPAEAALMADLLTRRPGTFLDIGAHVGYHTLRVTSLCRQVRRVVAVEADPDNVAYLRRNVAVNLSAQLADKVMVLPVAAWDCDGTVRIVRVDESNSGDNRISSTTGGVGVDVAAVRLDGVTDVTSEPVSLVKVDLQGRDHRALIGLSGVLERDCPDVLCEFSPELIRELGDDPALVLAGYRKLGYELVPLSEDGSGQCDTIDQTVIDKADRTEAGFVTLWLRPEQSVIADVQMS